MKRIGSVAMVVAAAVIIMSTGQAFSAEKHGIGGPASRSWQNDWQYEGTVEAGALPKGEDISKATLGGNEGFILREFGGVVYRVGVDTN